MTKPVGYFVSGQSIDLLTGMYGAYLQKLTHEQKIHLLYLAVEQLLHSTELSDEETDTSTDAWILVEDGCIESKDFALGLAEAIVSQLRYPIEVATPEQVAEFEARYPREKGDRPAMGQRIQLGIFTIEVAGQEETIS